MVWEISAGPQIDSASINMNRFSNVLSCNPNRLDLTCYIAKPPITIWIWIYLLAVISISIKWFFSCKIFYYQKLAFFQRWNVFSIKPIGLLEFKSLMKSCGMLLFSVILFGILLIRFRATTIRKVYRLTGLGFDRISSKKMRFYLLIALISKAQNPKKIWWDYVFSESVS